MLLDSDGQRIGVCSLVEAIEKAKEKNLDLVQLTEKISPPVCKITDYGKYLYWEKKKEKEKRSKISQSEIKGVRLKFGMSPHDLEIRVKSALKFLNEGNKVSVELLLKGRQKTDSLTELAKEKMNYFLKLIEKNFPLKIERDIKSEGRGLRMLISKENKK